MPIGPRRRNCAIRNNNLLSYSVRGFHELSLDEEGQSHPCKVFRNFRSRQSCQSRSAGLSLPPLLLFLTHCAFKPSCFTLSQERSRWRFKRLICRPLELFFSSFYSFSLMPLWPIRIQANWTETGVRRIKRNIIVTKNLPGSRRVAASTTLTLTRCSVNCAVSELLF